MSKIRQHIPTCQGELPEPTPDAARWVIYTRKRPDAPFKWAGGLNAVDEALALQYAREHYGLDETCDAILAHLECDATDGPYGLEPLEPGTDIGEDGAPWQVLTLRKRGGNLQTAGVVHAPDAATALERAQTHFADGRICNIRVVPLDKVLMTDATDMPIWRLHDMTYKLARGYSKEVRAKWTRIRDEQTYEDYRQGDIATHF